MKAEYFCIAKIPDHGAVAAAPKSMGSIKNQLETILFSDIFQFLNLAGFSPDMDADDPCSLRRNQPLNFIRINIVVVWEKCHKKPG